MPSGMIFVVIVAAHVRRRIQAALVGGGHCFIEVVGRNDALHGLPMSGVTSSSWILTQKRKVA